MPCKSGCPFGVRGGVYVVVADVCAVPGIGTSVKIAKAAKAIFDPTNQRFTRRSPLISAAIEKASVGRTPQSGDLELRNRRDVNLQGGRCRR